MIFDGSANTMMVAVIAMSRDTQVNMMNRNSACKHVPLPELGKEAFGKHSCNSGNANAVVIYVWKGGRQASILFAPTKPHSESGSVERLKAVAGRVIEKCTIAVCNRPSEQLASRTTPLRLAIESSSQ